jgi:guanylate kinase
MMNRESHSPLVPVSGPLLIVLSGLSGVGKDTVLAGIRESGLPLEISVSATTRPRRAAEKDGLDYHFVSPARFQEMIDNNLLLEWATVYGNRYGIPREPVRRALRSGRDILVKIDVQGAATIKKIVPRALFVFLIPPSMEELEERLKQRRTESSADLELRLKTASDEMKKLSMFDYVVVNHLGEVDRAIADIIAIITAEKCRVKPREISL